MSTLTRTRRSAETYVRLAEPVAVPSAPRHSVEAPETASSSREAPELRRSLRAEAPDAGEGRAAGCEHEFTHGRSQS